MRNVEIPVLVVGGGPVGLAGAHMLEKQGIKALIAEQYAGRLGAPKAHALNARSLEICASLGLPMDAIHAAATPADEGAFVRFMTDLTGREIGHLPYERQDEAVRAYTPWPLINIAQPDFERILEAELQSNAFATLERELEWIGCDILSSSVVSRLRDHKAGEDVTVRSRYLVAADGAGSKVRDAAGLKLLGPDALAHNITIHFEADLRDLVKDRPAILYFLFGLSSTSTLIAYDIGKTWVLMHSYDPARQSEEDFDEETCAALVREAIGADAPFEIKGTSKWVMTAQVADRYRAGNVFLAGDAAHRYPPTGGLGLNAGLADMENLVWKIAAVERGEAAPELLDTYDSERRAVAQTNSNQSVANALRLQVLLQALGQDIGREVDTQALHAALDDPENRPAIEAALGQQKDHFDSLRLQLGYIYGDQRGIDDALPVSDYRPRVMAGAYLPHCVLADGRSILDTVGLIGLTLIAGPAAEPPEALGARLGIDVHVVREGEHFTAAQGTWFEKAGLPPEGALLIRPDRHILHVAPELGAQSVAAMARAAADLLGDGPRPRETAA